MKNFRHLLLLTSAICIWNAAKAFGCTPTNPNLFSAGNGGCGIPKLPPLPDLPGLPKIPHEFPPWDPKKMIPFLPELPKVLPEFRHVDVDTVYSVTFRSENPNPPSCNIIAGRLKNHAARISEMSHLTHKVEKGQSMTFDEIRNYLEMTRKFVPEVLDQIDQTVELNITWKFLNFKPRNEDGIFYFLRNSPNNFQNFIIHGPGLKWTSTGETLPPFLDIEINQNVRVRYEMQMMDFCFGDNTISVRGKLQDEFGPEDPILKANWERDVLSVNQMGFWTIKTYDQLIEEKILDAFANSNTGK